MRGDYTNRYTSEEMLFGSEGAGGSAAADADTVAAALDAGIEHDEHGQIARASWPNRAGEELF